ncbi:MAG: hypothetical protein ABIA12_00665 [Candidatus Aenigmatarchaeota archaeon]
MNRTKSRLRTYWDKLILKNIPPPATFKKVEDEIREHFSFITWMIKRSLVPLAAFYIVVGLVFNMNVFGSLFLSLLVFLYSNFIPDADILIKSTKDKNKESLWYETYTLLFFAPLVAYYTVTGKARPLYSVRKRPFHNFKTAIVYGIFLFVVSSIFWVDALDRVMMTLFGVLGFGFHLIVDNDMRRKIDVFRQHRFG